MNIHESLGRREVLRRIGLAGVAVPVVGLLGTACDDKGDEAAAAEVVTGGEGGSQTVANSAGTAGAAATAAPQQAVDLVALGARELTHPASLDPSARSRNPLVRARAIRWGGAPAIRQRPGPRGAAQ